MEAIKHVISLEKEGLQAWSSGDAAGYGMHGHPDSVHYDNLGAQN